MPGALVLLAGRSFAGKSTLAALLADRLPASLIAYDAVNAERGLAGGTGIPVEEWLRTGAIAQDRARARLAAGGSAVVDDTSSPRFLRDEWRALAAAAGAAFLLVHVDAPPDLVRRRWLANRAARGRADVADEVMAAHLAAFEPPGPDEPHLWIDAGASEPAGVVAAVRDALARTAGPAAEHVR